MTDDAYLHVGDQPVARYLLDPPLDAHDGRRPYLHPVRTLAGTVVTDELPADHRWHNGASLAVPDVAGSNLWGGRTYRRADGYQWRDDHGRIVHTGWAARDPHRLAHHLEWRDRHGGVLLAERRELTATPVTPTAWALDLAYTLTAPDDRTVTLGSPATNGRPGGAGYGGFFWRATGSAGPAHTFTAAADGEEAVNGSAEPWLAFTGTGPGGSAYTLVFTGLGDGDRWFVRTSMYPGICVAFAFERPRVIAAGATRAGRHRVVVADGRLNRAAAAGLAAAAVPG